MAEFPALPLWTDAYLGDTTHLTTVEHGAYLLLLMVAWRTKDTCLPDDDNLLARYARCTPAQWKRLRPILEQFHTVADGVWRQRRLIDEAALVRARRDSAAANGRASALKRKGRHSTERNASDDAGDMQATYEASTTTPTPTPTPIEEEGKPSPSRARKARQADFELPKHIPADAWQGFVEMRRRIGKPLTDYAMEKIVGKLDEFAAAGHAPATVLDQSTMNGWQGIFEPKPAHSDGSSNPMVRAARALQAEREPNFAAIAGRYAPRISEHSN